MVIATVVLVIVVVVVGLAAPLIMMVEAAAVAASLWNAAGIVSPQNRNTHERGSTSSLSTIVSILCQECRSFSVKDLCSCSASWRNY